MPFRSQGGVQIEMPVHRARSVSNVHRARSVSKGINVSKITDTFRQPYVILPLEN